MSLFGGGGGGVSSRAKAEIYSQLGIDLSANDIIKQIQSLTSNGLTTPFDVSGMPRTVPQPNALQTGANQSALDLLNGQGGLGSALQSGLIDSLTQSGAQYLDPSQFTNWFNQSVADPAQFGYNRNLQQASNFVAGLGGERSGGFGTILGDTTNEFNVNLLGQRANMQSQLAQQQAQLEAQRLNRVTTSGIQAAMAPTGLAAGLGQQQFANEGAAGQEDLNRWLLQQPFMNPYVTSFLNTALGAKNPGVVMAGG